MKVLIIGANGQLGWELQRTCPEHIEYIAIDYPEIDISESQIVSELIQQISPDWVINAAAYTAVDKAEVEKDKAFRINGKGVEYIAKAIKNNGGRLVHISTDFIFDGKQGKPYQPFDDPNPESVYGLSKLKGEKSAVGILGSETTIIRTAWLYSSHGCNFVKTMIKLMANRDELKVVDDQIGTPCWARGLAIAIWRVVELNINGIFHWTDTGVASWYDFAVAIHEEALKMALIQKPISILPTSSTDYPQPAQRPSFSVLDKQSTWQALGIEPVHWQKQLINMLKELT